MTGKAADDRGQLGADDKPVVDSADDVFGKEFDTAAGIDTTADQPAAAASAENPPDSAKSKEGDDPPKPAEKPDEKDENSETFKQRWSTLQGIHKRDKDEWEKEKATLAAQLEEAKKPKAPENAAKPDEKKSEDDIADLLTEEEKKQLAEYEKDFATVTNMEGLKRKVEITRLEKKFDKFIKDILEKVTEHGAQIGPIAQRVVRDTEAEHFDTIKDKHNDFEKYRDDGSILGWINEKPAYMRPSLLEAYNNGTAQDVIDLVSDFKKEKNISTVATTDTSKVTDLNSKKEERRQALADVSTRRAAVNSSQAISEDFESAFDEALAK